MLQSWSIHTCTLSEYSYYFEYTHYHIHIFCEYYFQTSPDPLLENSQDSHKIHLGILSVPQFYIPHTAEQFITVS